MPQLSAGPLGGKLKMKSTIIVSFILSTLCVISCHDKSSSEVRTYQVGIVERDSNFYFQGSFYGHDTISLASIDGFVIHPEKWLSKYNNSIIHVSGNQIIPQRIGFSNVLFQFPAGEIDSFKIEIIKLNGRLVPKRLPPNHALKLTE